MKKLLIFLVIGLACLRCDFLQAFAPSSSVLVKRLSRASLSISQATKLEDSSVSLPGSKDKLAQRNDDERLSDTINKYLEHQADKDYKFCLPLEEIGLDDLPKVGGCVLRSS